MFLVLTLKKKIKKNTKCSHCHLPFAVILLGAAATDCWVLMPGCLLLCCCLLLCYCTCIAAYLLSCFEHLRLKVVCIFCCFKGGTWCLHGNCFEIVHCIYEHKLFVISFVRIATYFSRDKWLVLTNYQSKLTDHFGNTNVSKLIIAIWW